MFRLIGLPILSDKYLIIFTLHFVLGLSCVPPVVRHYNKMLFAMQLNFAEIGRNNYKIITNFKEAVRVFLWNIDCFCAII